VPLRNVATTGKSLGANSIQISLTLPVSTKNQVHHDHARRSPLLQFKLLLCTIIGYLPQLGGWVDSLSTDGRSLVLSQGKSHGLSFAPLHNTGLGCTHPWLRSRSVSQRRKIHIPAPETSPSISGSGREQVLIDPSYVREKIGASLNPSQVHNMFCTMMESISIG